MLWLNLRILVLLLVPRSVGFGFVWSCTMPTSVVGVGVDPELLEPVQDHPDGPRVDVADLSTRLQDVQRDADVGEHVHDAEQVTRVTVRAC